MHFNNQASENEDASRNLFGTNKTLTKTVSNSGLHIKEGTAERRNYSISNLCQQTTNFFKYLFERLSKDSIYYILVESRKKYSNQLIRAVSWNQPSHPSKKEKDGKIEVTTHKHEEN